MIVQRMARLAAYCFRRAGGTLTDTADMLDMLYYMSVSDEPLTYESETDTL